MTHILFGIHYERIMINDYQKAFYKINLQNVRYATHARKLGLFSIAQSERERVLCLLHCYFQFFFAITYLL